MTGPLFVKPSTRVLLFWAALAILNLAAGVVISSQAHRLSDLDTMIRWGGAWLVERQDVYTPVDSGADYPPNAIVLLSPLGALPLPVVQPLWMAANILMAVASAYLAARFFSPHAPFRVIALPILMFLCWGGVRTLTQFTLAALTFSMAAMVLADRRPKAAGVWLGLALMKPQVAVPIVLWSVFTRRWPMVVTSGAVVAALFAVYCLWSGANPFLVPARYAEVLAGHHTGEVTLTGSSELGPLIQTITRDAGDRDLIVLSLSLALLAGICVAGFQEGAVRRRVLYAAPPLAACWSLLTFYHLTYGFLILLPVMMLLALGDAEQSPLRRRLFWVMQIGMMFDVPGLSRRAGLAETGIYVSILAHADRVLIGGLLVGLAALAWREAPEPARPPAGH